VERRLFGPDEPDIGKIYVGPSTSPATRWPNRAYHPGRRVERERFIPKKTHAETRANTPVEIETPGYKGNKYTPWGRVTEATDFFPIEKPGKH
jgi:hypothetical protein